MKIYKEYFTRRSWSVIGTSAANKLLYKISGGRLGRVDTVTLKEEDMVTYSTGAPQQVTGMFSYERHWNKSSYINCRCQTTPISCKHKWKTTHTNRWGNPTRQECDCGVSRSLEKKLDTEGLSLTDSFEWVASDGAVSPNNVYGTI